MDRFGSFLVGFIIVWCLFSQSLSLHVRQVSKERLEDAFGKIGHHHDAAGEHDPTYDHQAILGSKREVDQYEELPAEESRKRLRALVTKGGMDANGDGYVDREELSNWVLKSFESLASEEGASIFADEDSNRDGYVSWDEHVNYNFDAEETKFQDTNEMIHEDKVLFKAADKNADSLLDIDEFPAFNSPEDFVAMHDALLQVTMDRKDTNKDGYLDFNEFIRDESQGTPDRGSETYIIEKERFLKDYDHNKDGKLDKNEILLWLIPDIRETADSEAEHLLSTCDDNNDGKLSVDEIVSHHDIFVGSEATDFGDHLHKISLHDEL